MRLRVFVSSWLQYCSFGKSLRLLPRFLELREPRAAAPVVVTNPGQAQFGIVQGSIVPHLREESARRTVEIGFEAYAIGGLSVGEPTDVMYDIVGKTAPRLPEASPRYLMGTGTPGDLVESVARGIDPAGHVHATVEGAGGLELALEDARGRRLEPVRAS